MSGVTGEQLAVIWVKLEDSAETLTKRMTMTTTPLRLAMKTTSAAAVDYF